MSKRATRVTFADEACIVCLTPFEELICVSKITFAECQHTICTPCLSKHMTGTTEVSKQTPCCKQPIQFSILQPGTSLPTFYKFQKHDVMGDRLFSVESDANCVWLKSLNNNMLMFNRIAEYIEEVAEHRTYVGRSGNWEQIYFQLPGHEDGETTWHDETSMHLVVARVKNNQLEFHWTDPLISINRVEIAGSSAFTI